MNKLLKNSRYDSNGWPKETGFIEAEVILLESSADEDTNKGWLALNGTVGFLLFDRQ